MGVVVEPPSSAAVEGTKRPRGSRGARRANRLQALGLRRLQGELRRLGRPTRGLPEPGLGRQRPRRQRPRRQLESGLPARRHGPRGEVGGRAGPQVGTHSSGAGGNRRGCEGPRRQGDQARGQLRAGQKHRLSRAPHWAHGSPGQRWTQCAGRGSHAPHPQGRGLCRGAGSAPPARRQAGPAPPRRARVFTRVFTLRPKRPGAPGPSSGVGEPPVRPPAHGALGRRPPHARTRA
mmetsp:Transcript_13743/g.32553  ORF Transcript_13743/g.32553 Transcript_13743/m.32553 type:complete len:234 (-) Transcript_13743:405-1106(-)